MFSRNDASKRLLVCLSSCAGTAQTDKHPYQMVKMTADLPCNLLFIRDSLGKLGTYYLCYHMDFEVIDTVCALIKKVCDENGIDTADVITVGSSKGASAALDRYILDELDENKSVIHLMTSEFDNEFESNMTEFLEKLKNSEIKHKVIFNNRIKRHNDVINYNPQFFMSEIINILFGISIERKGNLISISTVKNDIELTVKRADRKAVIELMCGEKATLALDDVLKIEGAVFDNGSQIFSTEIYCRLTDIMRSEYILVGKKLFIRFFPSEEVDVPLEYAIHVQQGGEVIHKTAYKKQAATLIDYDENAVYRFKCYIKNGDEILTYSENLVSLSDRELTFGEILELSRISLSITDNIIRAVLVPPVKFANNIKFSCSFYNNNICVYKTDFSAEKAFSYKIGKSGDYSAEFTVTDGAEHIVSGRKTISAVVSADDTRTVDNNADNGCDLFGSFACRDVFDYFPEGTLTLRNSVFQQSMFSALSVPFEYDADSIKTRTEFRKRVIIRDMNKDTFEVFSRKPSAYLLIDLLEERFPLIKKDNSILTLSEMYKEAFPNDDGTILKKRIIENELYIEDDKASQTVKEFCAKLTELYRGENIILHYALMADCYRDKDGNTVSFDLTTMEDNRRINRILEYLYNQIIADIPEICVIDERGSLCADVGNKRGLSPVNYSDDYYNKVSNSIQNILRTKR